MFLKKPVAYWLEELDKAGVHSGPINDFSQVFSDPHVRSRGMQVSDIWLTPHALVVLGLASANPAESAAPNASPASARSGAFEPPEAE